jgi:hypothetical protein
MIFGLAADEISDVDVFGFHATTELDRSNHPAGWRSGRYEHARHR